MDYTIYQSPFSWRYGSPEMRKIWSETNKRYLWRYLWVCLAQVQAEYGLVHPEQVADLRAHMDEIDIARALEIEAEIHHDLMAELKLYAKQAPLGGAILHLGATSTDIEDNADVLRIRHALELIMAKLDELLRLLAIKIQSSAELPLMGFTHLQPAEPTTLGYRLGQYAQDLLIDREALSRVRRDLKGKGFKGAVGSGAAYAELFGSADQVEEFETRLANRLGLPFFQLTTQVYPRKQDYQVITTLAGLGASLYRFAFDLRLLQSPPIGELSEPFQKKQVGSSAMPFKRNPINAEKINSLARQLANLPHLAWDNAAHSLLERTLDDSANRRTLLPEAFLIADELILTASRIIAGLVIHESALSQNLDAYGPFAASERVLMAACKMGADRQELHERLRQHAMKAWEILQNGQPNPLVKLLANDPLVNQFLPSDTVAELMDVRGLSNRHLGNAPARARQLAEKILSLIEDQPGLNQISTSTE